jgi:hypothetical protein
MALNGKREAFRVDVVARGLDHQRTTYLKAFGNYVANASTTFEAGSPVALNAAGEVILHTGSDTKPLGVAKYNKTTTLEGVISAQAVSFLAGGTVSLGHTNVTNLKITSDLAGVTAYAAPGDYSIVAATGVITHVAAGGGGTIPVSPTKVYCWYTYDLTAKELLDDGLNFWNMSDDVSIQGGKVTVITGDCEVFTTRYHTGRAWAVNDEVVASAVGDGAGMFDRNASSANNVVIGRVLQTPTATDPYLGIQLY